jgi:hypothetical protein
MKKTLKVIGANLPLLLAFGAAFYVGFFLRDYEAMRFYIIIAAFFMVFRELYEIRTMLKKATEDEGEGRHHV